MNKVSWARRFREPLIAVVSFLLLLIFLMVTNPQHLALVVLLIPFLLIFIVLYNLIMFVLRTVGPRRLSMRHKKVVAVVLSLEPVLLLLLASINQLAPRDGILSLILIIGFAWYLSRSTAAPGSA